MGPGVNMGSGRALEIVDLWKAYGDRWAVQGLSLDVGPGEIVGLVGPNGAGKTTTLKVLMGLVEADRGRVVVGGLEAGRGAFAYKAMVGYLPESPALPEYLNATEFLGYVARLRGVPAAEVPGRVDLALRTFGLQGNRRQTLGSFSKGMKQRVAIASSLIHDPSLLVWDEPFLGVDPAGQHLVKALLRDYVAAGHAALVSTHVLDSAERLCNRVVIIQEGRAIAQGGLDTLRHKAALGQASTLEEVFLKLTQEAGLPPAEETGGRGPRGWWRRP